jgi:hypothetical protein
MDDQQTNDQQRQSVDFLLAEHQFLADCFWRNEEAGERRVNFLIALVTAVAAGLVTLATSGKGDFLSKDHVYLIAIVVLLVLLAIGLVTLRRMIRRNQVTDEYKRAMSMIRSHFREADRWLQDYYPFAKVGTRKPGTGGLADLVSVINSFIVAALCALIARSCPGWIIGLSGSVGFVASYIGQFMYARHRYGAGGK